MKKLFFIILPLLLIGCRGSSNPAKANNALLEKINNAVIELVASNVNLQSFVLINAETTYYYESWYKTIWVGKNNYILREMHYYTLVEGTEIIDIYHANF